jgi:hypothetical protein
VAQDLWTIPGMSNVSIAGQFWSILWAYKEIRHEKDVNSLVILLYSDIKGEILVIFIFMLLCSLCENCFTVVLSELWGSPKCSST